MVVVGSGFTGLHAALALARGGREVLVIEAESLGFGASTRNNGSPIPYFYLKLDAMQKRFGEHRGTALALTAVESLDFFLDFIHTENIDCGLQEAERFFVARKPEQRDKLAALAAHYPRHGIDIGWEPISGAALDEETGLPGSAGGIVVRRSLIIHPGVYHAGLIERAKHAGVMLVDRTRMLRLARNGRNHRVETTRGTISARDVVVATNGYTGPEFAWGRRRLIGVRVFKAATEPLPDELRERYFPHPRVLVNTRLNHTVIRTTPDASRIIVGGRAGMSGNDARRHAQVLHRDLVQFIPDFRDVGFTHCWDGWMGFTFDKMPHYGVHDGIHYALGFGGVGITMGSWLGHRLGRRILGDDIAPTPIDELSFPTRPLYYGQHWPVALMTAWINVMDKLQ